MLKNPYNNLLFDHINGIEFFLIFWVQTLSYLPLLLEGHNRPWKNTYILEKIQQQSRLIKTEVHWST